MTRGTLLEIRAGQPRQHGTPGATGFFDKPWRSAIFKDPVAGPVRVTKRGVEGDQVSDTKHHGSEHQAVLAYCAAHYPRWCAELKRDDLTPGGFGENFVVDGLDEETVCIGDTFRVGDELVVQVSQPREPCSNLQRRFRLENLPDLVRQNGRAGWYLRVLAPGTVKAGDAIELLDRPFPALTSRATARARLDFKADRALTRALADCPLLSPEWRWKMKTGLL